MSCDDLTATVVKIKRLLYAGKSGYPDATNFIQNPLCHVLPATIKYQIIRVSPIQTNTYGCYVRVITWENGLFYLTFCIMNIFVAKLNFKTSKEDLEAAFATCGQVTSCKIVRDKRDRAKRLRLC